MEPIGGVIFGLVVLVVMLYAIPRLLGGNQTTCTRCDGTGHIDERWPDPSEPSGFHVATGECPKCKGKGKVRT
jgi:hypothetical protein